MVLQYQGFLDEILRRTQPVGRPWVRRVQRTLVAVDIAAVVGATAIALGVTPGWRDGGPSRVGPGHVAYTVAFALTWVGALGAARTRERRVLGYGPTEYVRTLTSSWEACAAVTVVALAFEWTWVRGFMAVAFCLGCAFLVGLRYAARQVLHRRRAAGLDKSPVLVVGPFEKVATLIDEFHGEPSSEFVVCGVCLPGDADPAITSVKGLPVLGSTEDAGRVARELSVHAVAVAGADRVTSKVIRRLGWELEGTGIDLVLTTALIDVAGPRVKLRSMNSLPLLYVDEAQFAGPKYWAKSAFDRLLALALAVVLAPALIVIAVLVKVTSPGPILFVQQRVGLGGRPFGMLKFRSMVVGAADQLAAVLEAEGAEVGMFYKPKNDPRVTPFGRFIRKYSLDELPQLFNVIRGEMSLVGPRPQITDEVALYDAAASRRLLVKPGLTGLWQISGRSELTPEQAIRLDLRYAENWSMLGDLLILARTAKVVVAGDGAR